MLLIDLAIVGLTALLAIWGFRRGLTVRMLALVGFAVGALVGSRVAPLVLDRGVHSPAAPVLALPGALLLGALMAAVVERFALRHQQRLSRLGAADGVLGAIVAGGLGLIAAWGIGTALVQAGWLKDPVERSAVLERLDAALPAPGPIVASEPAPSEQIPTLAGPGPNVRKADPAITRDPQVRAASRSVVRISVKACDGRKSGSGWVAADGVVATNAHVAIRGETFAVGFSGKKPSHPATPIWFDKDNDIALLRVPELSGTPALQLARKPKSGTSGAVLGYPAGRRLEEIRPGRLGGTTSRRADRMGEPIPRSLYGKRITTFVARVQPGNSGGPIVDEHGRVLTTVFGKFEEGFSGAGVANSVVRAALPRAHALVDTGSCDSN